MKRLRELSVFALFTGAALIAVSFVPAHAANGSFWQDVRATVNIRELATNGSVYVAADSTFDNTLWTSTDLKTWSRANVPTGSGNEFTSVAYAHGLFVAVSNNAILTSSDGVTWSVSHEPVSYTGSAIAYGNGLYLVVSTNEAASQAVILTSADGKTWSLQDSGITVPSGHSITIHGAAWDGTQFAVAASLSGSTVTDVVITSADGKTWTQASLPSGGSEGYASWSNETDVIAWGNGIFVAGGGANQQDQTSGVYTSSDGINWTVHALPDSFSASSIQFVNGWFIAPGRTNAFAFSGSTTGYLVSTDGINWTFRSIDPEDADLNVAGFLFTGSEYAVASEAGVWTSPDLNTWTQVFSNPRSNTLNCLGHGSGTGYVALGEFWDSEYSEVLTSSDGRTWPDDLTEVPPPVRWGYAGDGCLAYGAGGYVNGNYHSADGVHWEQSTVPPNDAIIYVADNGSEYLGVTADSSVLESTDGANWTPVSDNLPSVFYPDGLKAMNGAFFLTGTDGNGHAKIMRSTDGSTWADVTPSAPAGFHRPHLGYGNGVYVAIGNDDQYYTAIARSDDGAHWTIETDAFPNGLAFYPFSISYGGGEFLAVGFDPVGGYGEYLVSHDGSHWTATDYDALYNFNTVLWDGSKFVATGAYNILNAPGVTLNVSGSGPASVEAGADFAYTVSVTNDGDITADEVVLNDTLATAATFKSATTSQGTCTNGAGGLSCELGTLAAGGKATVKLTYTAGSDAGSAKNEASAYAYQPIRDDADPHSSTTVTVTAQSISDKTGGATGSGGGGGTLGLLGLAALLSVALRRRCGLGRTGWLGVRG